MGPSLGDHFAPKLPKHVKERPQTAHVWVSKCRLNGGRGEGFLKLGTGEPCHGSPGDLFAAPTGEPFNPITGDTFWSFWLTFLPKKNCQGRGRQAPVHGCFRMVQRSGVGLG